MADTDISQVLEQIDNGKLKVYDSSDAPKQIRETPLTPEQMEKAVKFAQALPGEWKTVLPAKDYIKLPRTRDKVAIVGFANSWNKAPFKDDSFEIWGINELYKYFQAIPGGRADRWFEIHNRKSPSKSRPEHIEWLQKATIPIYMWEHYDDMPGSMPYPKDAILEELKKILPYGYRYFTNQISWMMALAWYEGFKEVHVYGVNMATDSEFGFQRPSVESWIFFLQCMGIKVYLPEECDLLKPPSGHLYGFDSDNAARVLNKQRMADLKPRNSALVKALHMNEFKREEILRELRKTEGRIMGASDALKAQNREQVDALIKGWRSELENTLAAYVQTDEIIRQSDINIAELRGATGAYDDVLKHIL